MCYNLKFPCFPFHIRNCRNMASGRLGPIHSPHFMTILRRDAVKQHSPKCIANNMSNWSRPLFLESLHVGMDALVKMQAIDNQMGVCSVVAQLS